MSLLLNPLGVSRWSGDDGSAGNCVNANDGGDPLLLWNKMDTITLRGVHFPG